MVSGAAFRGSTLGRLCVFPHKSTNESACPVLSPIRGYVRRNDSMVGGFFKSNDPGRNSGLIAALLPRGSRLTATYFVAARG
jgi:hypothetical protein